MLFQKGNQLAKGLIPWNKGIPCSIETKTKIRNKLKGIHPSYETRRKRSDKLKGKTWEEIYGIDGAEKRRASLFNKIKIDEIDSLLKKNFSINKISKLTKHNFYNIKGFIIKNKLDYSPKKVLSIDHKLHIGLGCKGKNLGFKHSEATKEKIRRNTVLQHLRGFPQTNTKIELIMKDILDELKIGYIHPYNFNNKFACDFAIPDKKIIIECDGDYWHNREDIKNRDKSKNAYITTCKWKILRFWEHDIEENRPYIKDNLLFELNHITNS